MLPLGNPRDNSNVRGADVEAMNSAWADMTCKRSCLPILHMLRSATRYRHALAMREPQ